MTMVIMLLIEIEYDEMDSDIIKIVHNRRDRKVHLNTITLM